MSGDTLLIQDAVGAKLGNSYSSFRIHWRLYNSIRQRWLLTLVMLSSIPLLVAAGAAMPIIINKMASCGQSKAANVVEQTIGSIRTVSSSAGKREAITSCNKHLVDAYKSGVSEGSAVGVGLGLAILGCVQLICLGSMVWFIDDKRRWIYWGKVLNAIV